MDLKLLNNEYEKLGNIYECKQLIIHVSVWWMKDDITHKMRDTMRNPLESSAMADGPI